MGLSTSKSKSTTTPVYGQQIEGAADKLTSAYDQNSGTVQGITDTLTGFTDQLADRYTNGDPTVNAAQNYNTNVLNGQYLDAGNPYLEQMIQQTGNDLRNQDQAYLGLKGLTGGSDYASIISSNLAKNALGMRYADYGAERDRMANASSQAGQLAAAREIPLNSLLSIQDAAQDPLKAALGYSSGVSGLLGPYTNTKTKSKNSVFDTLASMASNAAAAYAGS